MRRLIGALLMLCMLSLPACQPRPSAATHWRSGWFNGRLDDKVFATARELRFHALITPGSIERLQAFSAKASAAGLESYWWMVPYAPAGQDKVYAQVMRPADVKRLAELKADKERWAHGYQGGGEPLPGRHDMLLNPISCFHRPEVLAATKERITKVLQACPQLTGLAYDMFGYQNFRDCRCPESERQFGAYWKQHPKMNEEAAREAFSLDTLVAFYNALSHHARQVRPDVKITVHVWPTFLPEPLYGNRLDLDYCCQTVAWFFQPYWREQKIAAYTRTVVEQAQLYHARQCGVPFIGIFVGRGARGDKSAARVAEELRVIFRSTRSRSLSTYNFCDVVEHPEIKVAMQSVFHEFGIR